MSRSIHNTTARSRLSTKMGSDSKKKSLHMPLPALSLSRSIPNVLALHTQPCFAGCGSLARVVCRTGNGPCSGTHAQGGAQ
jgi:hypothetical protein